MKKLTLLLNFLKLCIALIVVSFQHRLPMEGSKSEIITQSPTHKVAKVPNLWQAPDTSTIPHTSDGQLIRYGRDLVANTSKYFGPKGSIKQISNGMNCQNCHLEAGTKPWGNNYGAVYTSYPKFRARSGSTETIVKRISDCFERSLNGTGPDSTTHEMKAMVAYMQWLGSNLSKGEKPVGSGLKKMPYMDRAANIENGAVLYKGKCAVCHGTDGNGILAECKDSYLYPPLWGTHSYNNAAGLYRISNFASFIKNNMPLGVNAQNPVLSDEEAWDIAAFVNTQMRPDKNQINDWKDIGQKPIDFPFGPFADPFSETQHKYGPFGPISKK